MRTIRDFNGFEELEKLLIPDAQAAGFHGRLAEVLRGIDACARADGNGIRCCSRPAITDSWGPAGDGSRADSGIGKTSIWKQGDLLNRLFLNQGAD